MLRWIKLLCLLVVSGFSLLPCYSQSIEVTDFKKSKRFWPLRKNFPTDKKCAWLDLRTSDEGFTFWADGKVQIEAQPGDGYLTLHLPHKTSFVEISHEKFGQYTWKIPNKPLKKKKHYKASLVTYDRENAYQLKKQWVSFKISPSNAWLYVDSTRIVTRTGIAELFLPLGKHGYRIESPFYETLEDTFLLTGRKKVEIPVEMQPIYSYLTVTTPFKDAEIWIDDCYVGKREGTSQRLMEGVHKLAIVLNDKICYEENVYVTKSEKKNIRVDKEAFHLLVESKMVDKQLNSFSGNSEQVEYVAAPVSIYASDENEEILIDREVVALGKWKDNLPIGKYAVQSRKEGLESGVIWLYVNNSQPKELWLPTHSLAFGFLSVHCNVPDAEIWINGKMMGKTPLVVDSLPAGKPLKLELKKVGYKTLNKQIVLLKNNLSEFKFNLDKENGKRSLGDSK